MKPLKAFINKDVLKRMRHNADNIFFIVNPTHPNLIYLEQHGCDYYNTDPNRLCKVLYILDNNEIKKHINSLISDKTRIYIIKSKDRNELSKKLDDLTDEDFDDTIEDFTVDKVKEMIK